MVYCVTIKKKKTNKNLEPGSEKHKSLMNVPMCVSNVRRTVLHSHLVDLWVQEGSWGGEPAGKLSPLYIEMNCKVLLLARGKLYCCRVNLNKHEVKNYRTVDIVEIPEVDYDCIRVLCLSPGNSCDDHILCSIGR